MDVKVSIEFKNEFDQVQIAESGLTNVDSDIFENDLDFIFTHVEYALKALGFTENSIEEMINRAR